MHTSALVGIALATLHLALLGYVVWMIHSTSEPDWPMYWTTPLVIDLPASLLILVVGRLLFGNWMPKREAQAARALDVQNFIFPLFFLCVVGTAWWFLLPQGIAWAWNRAAG